jgi:signal transduction histidine kinase
VEVSFHAPGHLQVGIRDNGCGFDVDAASRKADHWGLAGMRERAGKLGAEFSLESVPGHGTEIKIRLRNLHSEESSISHV